MATPARAPESPPAAEPAPAVGPAGDPCPPRQPQPVRNVLAAPRLRAPSSRGLGAAEFGGAAGEVEAPGETFAQRKIHLQIARQR
uniref:Polymerase (RNA) II (DNA directed) polypeptide M n=1 Tax=Mus musculus TaxID=10090 RepID=A0A3B2WBC6_MOUSE